MPPAKTRKKTSTSAKKKPAARKPPVKKPSDLSPKPTVKKRGVNVGRKPPRGAPFNDQDVKRRLGNFMTTGEHSRQGGRTTGIVGQTKQKNKTDKKSK